MKRRNRCILATKISRVIFKKKEYSLKFLQALPRTVVSNTHLEILCNSIFKACNTVDETNPAKRYIQIVKPTHYKNSKTLCMETGRGKGLVSKFCLSRITLKKFIESGSITGYSPASW